MFICSLKSERDLWEGATELISSQTFPDLHTADGVTAAPSGAAFRIPRVARSERID